jgi:hypothetical protein
LLTRFSPYASPALSTRARGYPYGNVVPVRVRMLRTFWPELAAVESVGLLPIAFVGQEYSCYVASTGDVAVFLPFDQLLQIDPGSSAVVAYHDRPGALASRSEST